MNKLIKLRNILIYIDIILVLIAFVLVCKHIIKLEDENKELKEELNKIKIDIKIKYEDILSIIEK